MISALALRANQSFNDALCSVHTVTKHKTFTMSNLNRKVMDLWAMLIQAIKGTAHNCNIYIINENKILPKCMDNNFMYS